MISQEPLITIAIPTYNRLAILKDTLELLALQEGFHDPTVEIIISDNASPVDPRPMLEEFQRAHSRKLVLHRNTSNEGIDGNIHRVADLATGRYVLFMSDDDILLPNTLRRLQQMVCTQTDLLFCFVNGFPFTGIYSPDKTAPPIIKINSTLQTRSADEFIETVWVWSTFLSAFFVERRAWLGVVDRQRYIGTDIYLTHVLYRLLAQQRGRTKIVTAEPLVAARMEYTGSFRIFFAFGVHFMKLLCEDAPRLGFSARTLRAIKIRTMKAGLPPMILMVRRGPKPRRLSWQELGMLFRYTWWEPVAWLYMLPLIVLPRSAINGLIALKHRLRGRAAPAVANPKP